MGFCTDKSKGFSINIENKNNLSGLTILNKNFFVIICSALICITVFSIGIQNSFGETRQECRSAVGQDQTLTPVERVLALRACSLSDSIEPTFEEIYTEKLHNECDRRGPHDTWFNHVLRLKDLEKCNKLQEIDTTLSKQKITKYSKYLIDFCGEKYGVYQLVGAKKLRNHAGISTPICLDLYSTPIWNSTDKDRQVKLHNFLMETTQQRLEVSKELREKIVEESRLNRPIITTLKDLFDEQKEKIEYLENQLQEKNVMPNYHQQDFFSKKLEGCSKIYYDNEILLKEKIIALNECSGLEAIETITINRTAISEYSKNTVQYCEERYSHFSKLSRQEFYDSSTKDPLTHACSVLYGNPLWDYNQSDRAQVLEALLYYEIVKSIYENSQREDSAFKAILDSRWEPILFDIYQYQKLKIGFLESLLKID